MSAPTAAPPTRPAGPGAPGPRALGPTRGWRPALRMGWRDLRRHRGRTAAAAVMVFLPVLAASGVAVTLATLDVSADERTAGRQGGGAAVVSWSTWTTQGTQDLDGPPGRSEVESLLGAGALEVVSGAARVRADGRTVGAATLVTELGDPLADGLVVPLDGRLPAAGDEAALTPGLADALGVGVGDTVEVARAPRTVVGLAVGRYENPATPVVVLVPAGAPAAVGGPAEVWWVLGAAADPARVADARGAGLAVRGPGPTPELEGTGPSADGVLLVAVAVTLAALEIALLAGPAFAVGVRQQQRTLSLLAATGADARALGRVVLAQALLVGALAAASGGVLGVVLPAVALEALRYRVPASMGPVEVPWAVAGFVAVGVLAALASALVPAVTAVRATVVRGLAPRPARARVPWRRPLAGAVLVLSGAAVLFLGIASAQYGGGGALPRVGPTTAASVSVLLLGVGMVLLVPLPVALVGRATRGLPPGVRLAGRETTRAGARSVAAVSAVAGATAGLVAAACLTTTLTEEARRAYVPAAAPGVHTVVSADVLEDRRRVEQALPGWRTAVTGTGGAREEDGGLARVDHWLRTPGCEDAAGSGTGTDPGECLLGWLPVDEGSYAQRTAVLDREAALLLGYDLDEAQLAVLDAGGVLLAASAPVDVTAGTVGLRGWTQTFEVDGGPDPEGRPAGAVEVPVATFEPVPGPSSGDGSGQALLVLSPAAAEEVGGWYPVQLLAAPPDAGLTAERVARAAGEQLREVLGGSGPDVAGQVVPTTVSTETGFRDPYRLANLLVLLVAGVVVLGATLTATALALADARRDRGVLTALGASPGTQRLAAGSTAALLALTGAVVGAAVGLVPGVMVSDAMLDPTPSAPGLVLPGRFGGVLGGALEVVPWWALGAGVLGLPLLAGTVVALVATGRPATEVVRRGERG